MSSAVRDGPETQSPRKETPTRRTTRKMRTRTTRTTRTATMRTRTTRTMLMMQVTKTAKARQQIKPSQMKEKGLRRRKKLSDRLARARRHQD